MVINQGLRETVRCLSTQILQDFESEGADIHSAEFLASFPYAFMKPTGGQRCTEVLAAASSLNHRSEIERAIKAAYTDSAGLTTDGYICKAVEDFLNYVIPRIAGLPDEEDIFAKLYEQFESSILGETALVTVFAVLSNVWDNGGRAILPPGFSLQYVADDVATIPDSRWKRDRSVPYFEISKSAHPIGRGRPIKDESYYFIFKYSTMLPNDGGLIRAAYALSDAIVRKFIFSIRLLNYSAAFSDYRGFRTVGHLSAYSLNLMNHPDDFIARGPSRELSEHDGVRLRRLLPKLASEPYEHIAALAGC